MSGVDRPAGAAGEGQPRTLAGDRLVIRGPLGTGATGVVYLALDRARGHEVAVKVLRDPSAEALVRLKTEFRALADLRHPNLVRLHDLIDDGATWMLTMEVVTGVDFLRWVRPVPTADADGLLDENRLRHAAGDLARGLEALHQSGYLHRDIKPSNVLVTDAGRVVLLDGGLVAHLVDGRQAKDGDVIAAGTLAYMAPEQGAGRRLTPKSDWYAVGALIYHALTGRPPFLGTAVEVISARLLDEPPRPSTFVPGVAPDLDQLAVDLLHRRPRQRPSGPEVVRRLGGDAAEDGDTADGIDDALLPLVGRDRELGMFAPLLAKGWGPRAVVVTGPPGVGKTALVREAVRRLELRRPDAWVVVHRTHPRADVPLRGLDGLVDELARRLRRLSDAERTDALPALRLLAARFPVLASIAAPSSADPAPDDADTATALGELLARIGLDRALVLVIDDAHLARPAALELLRAALGSAARPRVAVVAIGRDDTPWWRALADADAVVPIGELDQDDALAVAGQRVVPETAPAVVASCGGHPGLIIEVARLATDVAGWYAQRAARLADETRALLEVVARADAPLAPATADLAANAGAPLPPGRLDELAAARLIRIDGDGRLAAYHPRVGAAIIAACDAARLRAIDLALAAALAGAGEALAAARRWLAAGDLVQARDVAARAAGAAATAGDHEQAIAAYQLAIACDDDTPPPSVASAQTPTLRATLHGALAEVLGWTGRVDDAVRAYLAAAERSSPRRALEARRRAAELLLHDGQLDAGAALFAQVFADLGLAPLPRRGDHDVAGLIAHAREAGGAAADPLTASRLDALWSAASAWSEVDPARTSRLRRVHAELARAAGDPRRRARAVALEATAAGARRRLDHAEHWARALAIAREVGLAEDPAFTAGPTAYAALHAGELRGAAIGFERVIDALRERGILAGAGGAAAVALALACRAHLGDLPAARAVIDRVRDIAARDRALGVEIAIGGGGLVALAAGDPDAVLAAAERAARWPGRGFTGMAHQRLMAAWHAHVYRGDPAAARGEIEAAYPAARRAGATAIAIARLDLLRMRALARALTRDAAGAAADRDRVAAIPLALARPAAEGITAAILAAAGDLAGAAEAWTRSARGLATAGLALHARAAEWRAARAAGHDAAAKAIAAAVAGPGLTAPAQLFAALAPAV
jgi:hypothetical protein